MENRLADEEAGAVEPAVVAPTDRALGAVVEVEELLEVVAWSAGAGSDLAAADRPEALVDNPPWELTVSDRALRGRQTVSAMTVNEIATNWASDRN